MSPESDLCEWCDGSAKPLQEASIGFSVDCPNGCKPRAVPESELVPSTEWMDGYRVGMAEATAPESAPGAHGTHETCGKDHLIGEPCPVPGGLAAGVVPPVESNGTEPPRCGLCREVARGYATIGGVRYCHEARGVTCYMKASLARGGVTDRSHDDVGTLTHAEMVPSGNTPDDHLRTHDGWDIVAELREERDRLISTNDTLVARIEDLNQGYGLEDTCPRVQCRSTSRRLKAQCEQMRRAVEYALQGFSTDADAPFLALFRKRYRKAMER